MSKIFLWPWKSKAVFLDPIPGMYAAQLQKAKEELFQIRIEKEAIEAGELTLMKRITRLQNEQRDMLSPMNNVTRFGAKD